MIELKFGAVALAITLASMAPQPAGAQAAKRGLGAAAQALAEQANRQIDLENELAAAQARADIEFEQMKRVHALRKQQAAQQTSTEREFAALDRSYPAWFEHAESKPFKTWLSTQPAETKARFDKAQVAEDLLAVINEHRMSLGMEPRKLRR